MFEKCTNSELVRETKRVVSEERCVTARVRELWGNQELSDSELIGKMARLVLERIDPERRPAASNRSRQSVGAPKVEVRDEGWSESEAAPAKFVTPATRYIPAQVRRDVWRRDQGRCTFMAGDRRCASRYALQLDHLDPYAFGGVHTVDNLRLLCRNHHRARKAA